MIAAVIIITVLAAIAAGLWLVDRGTTTGTIRGWLRRPTVAPRREVGARRPAPRDGAWGPTETGGHVGGQAGMPGRRRLVRVDATAPPRPIRARPWPGRATDARAHRDAMPLRGLLGTESSAANGSPHRARFAPLVGDISMNVRDLSASVADRPQE